MKIIKSNKLRIIYSLIFFSLINIYSCCVFKTDDPDLRITGQNFPSQVGVSQTFNPTFTVGNFSNGECEATRTNQSSVVLRMVNRVTGHVQVNDPLTLNPLDNNDTQNFNFSVIIGTAGTYDLTFTVDPNHTSGETNNNNNTLTGVIIVQ